MEAGSLRVANAALVGLVVLTCQARGEGRVPIDKQAMKEAIASGASSDGRYSSAASYAHFLVAKLHHFKGEHRRSVDELKLALATDDGNPFLQVALAEQWARFGDMERAEKELVRVVDEKPGYAPAQLLLGRVLYEQKKFSRARAHLTRAMRLRPHHEDAYLIMAQSWLELDNPTEAVAVVEAMGLAIPGEPSAYKRLGLALLEREDYVRAEALLLKASARDSGDFETWVSLGHVYEATRRLEQSEGALARAVELEPENTELLLSLGKLALRQDSLERAKGYFGQLLSASRDPEVIVKVAFAYLAARQLVESAETLDNGRKDSPLEPRLHFYSGLVHERLRAWNRAADAFALVPKEAGDLFNQAKLHRASCLSQSGQHKVAVALLDELQKEHSASAAVSHALSRALERGGQTKRAEVVLMRSLAEEPVGENFEALASFYERQGRPSDAVELLSQALRRSPHDVAVLYTLGAVYERLGDFDRSLEKMRAVLAVNPDHAEALNFVGYTLSTRGRDLVEAERLVQRALELKPESPAFLDSLGWVYFQKGDFVRAVEMLERAVAAAPGEPTIDEHLGDAYAKATRFKDAEKAYHRALKAIRQTPELADSKDQSRKLERKLKMLSSTASAR